MRQLSKTECCILFPFKAKSKKEKICEKQTIKVTRWPIILIIIL